MIFATFPVTLETNSGEQTWLVTMESAWREWLFVSAENGAERIDSETAFLAFCEANCSEPDLQGLASDAYQREHGVDDPEPTERRPTALDWSNL